jgi:Uma2 family endonuclease
MRVPEFLAWAAAQPRGRYELVDGEIVAMAPERARHNLAKLAVARALGDAIARARLHCTVFTDGMTVVIDEYHSREPDAAVQCGVATDLDSMILEAPLIVVEVASPSSERDDTGDKLVEYFSVASIRHYLIVNPFKRVVVHHARNDLGTIETRIVSGGTIDLSPPGMAVAAADMLAGADGGLAARSTGGGEKP